jgi:hypothetical protein
MLARDVGGLLRDAGATASGAPDSREGAGGSRPEAASLRERPRVVATGMGRRSRHAERLMTLGFAGRFRLIFGSHGWQRAGRTAVDALQSGLLAGRWDKAWPNLATQLVAEQAQLALPARNGTPPSGLIGWDPKVKPKPSEGTQKS